MLFSILFDIFPQVLIIPISPLPIYLWRPAFIHRSIYRFQTKIFLSKLFCFPLIFR